MIQCVPGVHMNKCLKYVYNIYITFKLIEFSKNSEKQVWIVMYHGQRVFRMRHLEFHTSSLHWISFIADINVISHVDGNACKSQQMYIASGVLKT